VPPPRVAFVYPNPRDGLVAGVAAGTDPDSTLLGQNHLGALGFETRVVVPPQVRGRLGWALRELPLPWRVGDAEVAFTPLAALFPLAARLRGRPRVVVVNYGLNLIWRRSGRARRALLRAVLRSAALVVCLGESQRLELLELSGLAAGRVATLALGVDADFWSPRSRPAAGDPYVLAVGKDLSRDYATLAEAVRPLGVRTEIVALPRNVRDLRLPEGARARSDLAATDLRDAYHGAACVVVPQRRDGYPYGSEGGGLTSTLEAMSTASPLVATRRAILRDYVSEGETALLVPPEDPEALRAAIERMLTDPALGRRLGGAARADVEERFTTRRLAERLAPLLERAAAR
jgi:glycosyltransferase involved in cell wall biosynthesis